ncbi:unnamed protein product [Hymenolepis diminuta]|uniref:RRP15-like protein n=1 Tax=Hymenolepis diminuta TaxID=6216 RepID=A0A0R3SAK4_HYMDI|nr:unnamed protein product [Hymenolepis diminuta]
MQPHRERTKIRLRCWAEVFTLDQKIVERIAGVVKAAEKQRLFSPKKKKLKSQLTASPNKVIEILEERDFDEGAASVDDDEGNTTSSNFVNLQKKRELDRELREEMTQKMLSSDYQFMNRKRKQLPTFAKKQVR